MVQRILVFMEEMILFLLDLWHIRQVEAQLETDVYIEWNARQLKSK